jgi:hypothetical protein
MRADGSLAAWGGDTCWGSDPSVTYPCNQTSLTPSGAGYLATAAGSFGGVALRPSAAFLAADLVDTVAGLQLPAGVSESLDAKLAGALEILNDQNASNDVAAVNKVQAFINQVQAQAGKKLPQADAEALIVAAQQIIDLLSG